MRIQLSDLPRLLQLEPDIREEPRADDPRPESQRSVVVFYFPDTGISNNSPVPKVYTKQELTGDGHDFDSLDGPTLVSQDGLK